MAGEKSTTYSGQLLALLFNGTTIANVAINATSSPITNIYIALHTADPTAGGTQSSNEVAYTGYARVAVARTTGGWTITGNSVSPVANIIFPIGTGGSGTATYWSAGLASSGATEFFYSAPISPSIVLGNGVTPTLTTASYFAEA